MTDQKQLFDTQPEPWELDAQADALVAKVVFPRRRRASFDYLIPEQLRDTVKPGARLNVRSGVAIKNASAIASKCTPPSATSGD